MKVLTYSRDKNEGKYNVLRTGKEEPDYVTPDLSYYCEGAQKECEDNKPHE